jgi:phage shock protein PspC (stress-responsive transcriptional regulator)
MTDTDAVTSSRAQRRWRRSSDDRYLAGVAAGVARSLDVDPLLVRVVLVVGAVFAPVVLIGYAIVWLLVPVDGAPHSLLRSIRQPAAFREVLGAIGLIIGAAIMLPEMRPGGSSDLQLGVILIAAGALLLLRPQVRPPEPTAGGLDMDVDASSPTDPRAAAAPRRGRERRETPEERPRSGIALLAVSLLVLTGAVAAAVDQSGREVSLGVVSSVAAVIVGAALTLSGWRGRARSLILLVPALVAAWIAFAPADVVLYPGGGSRTHTIASASEVAADYRLGFGSMTLDAGSASFASEEAIELDARLTGGRLRIDVPADARLRLVGRVGVGGFDVYDDRWGWSEQMSGGPAVNHRFARAWPALGPACARREIVPWNVEAPPKYVDAFGAPCVPSGPPANAPEVTVNVTLGTGYLEVHRVPPSR